MKRALLAVAVAALACTRAPQGMGPREVAEPQGPLAEGDPTVQGARLVPLKLDLSQARRDASGAVRGVIDGLRFVSKSRGSLFTALQRVEGVTSMLAVPSRLGGGYLFAAGDTVYRAEDWLDDPHAILHTGRPIEGLLAGLDRVYVETGAGHVALEATTGQPLELGPWPNDPLVLGYLALDGWSGLALTDFRGVVTTSNAGRSWEKLEVPMPALGLVAVHRAREGGTWVRVASDGSGGAIEAVIVSDGALSTSTIHPGSERCVVVSPTFELGSVTRCSELLRKSEPRETERDTSASRNTWLERGIENGWPMGDGTVLVASQGGMTHVSLVDGSVKSRTEGAYDVSAGDCHAVPLSRTKPAPAIARLGFVCGADEGRTSLFTYDESASTLRLVRGIEAPRRVMTSTSGAWLVFGSCKGPDESDSHERHVCIGSPEDDGRYVWSERRLQESQEAAVGLLKNGALAEVTLPHEDEGATLVVTGVDGRVTKRALEVEPNVEPLLKRGVWVGGLEETAEGALSGWLAEDGTFVGLQVAGDGSVKVGAYVRDLGSPFVSGRYGLGFTRSHRGYETIDGGMTWRPFVAPTPLGPSEVRSCGPAGCTGDGWLRVGWGERPAAPMSEPVHALGSWTPPPTFQLTCHLDSKPPAAKRAEPWFHEPKLQKGQEVAHADMFGGYEGARRLGPLGRVYAWGPAGQEWSGFGSWSMQWRSPFAGGAAAATSAVTQAPFRNMEMALNELGFGRSGPATWTVLVDDDPKYALLLIRRPSHLPELMALTEQGHLAPLTRADGEAWGMVEAATRLGGDWYLATTDPSRRGAVSVFRQDGDSAKLVTAVERLLPGAPTPVRLAHGAADGRLGLVVDGELLPDRNVARRWVVPIDVESGQLEPPEPLGAADLSDRADLRVCPDDVGSGWVFGTSWPAANVTLGLAVGRERTTLRQVYARLRASADRVCVERLTGEAPVNGKEAGSFAERPREEPTLPLVLTNTGLLYRCRQDAQK